MILGIDTASAIASVALVSGGQLLAERIHAGASAGAISGASSPRGNHAEVILPLIQSVLQDAGAGMEQVRGIAISIGPGSFTGLRIGLATAKGIAYEVGLPVAGVSTLHANAARVKNFEGVVCALLDARKGEVYTALFRRAGCGLERLTDDELTSIEKALALARSQKNGANAAMGFVGDGIKAYGNAIAGEFGAGALYFNQGSVAAAAALLAEGRLGARSGDEIGSLAPVYLRPSEAEAKLLKSSLTY
jgi:tRNA threonylcarbamoyladenosine biosynthesis protein TsaB